MRFGCIACAALLWASAARAAGAAPVATQPVVDAPTEALIGGALRFLASRQLPNGSWVGPGNNHQAAITAYVLHTFLAAGELPGEGAHGRTVERGLSFLLDCARGDGYIAAAAGENNMYGHGIATVILGEAYGNARDPRLRPALVRAVNLIVACQNAQGGWRYQPRVADADISVTVLQAAALRVAQNAGLTVPQGTIDRAVGYVRQCFDAPSGGFYYQATGGTPGFARTCAAIYMLQLLGKYDDPMVARGAAYAAANLEVQQEWFTYGNFYAGPAMYMIGGETWRSWHATLAARLIPLAQRSPDGRLAWWKPIDGGNGQNDVYATAVYASILALPYQYLPIYQR